MTDTVAVTIFAALVFSAFIKGSLGLGFSTICVAILVHVVDLKTAISIVLFPSLLSNLIVMIDAGHFRASLAQFWLMLLMAMPGMWLGFQLLNQVDNRGSLLLLGGVLMVYGVLGYWQRHWRLFVRRPAPMNALIGLSTGMVNGATGSQIFPIMPYLLSLPISKDLLVQTINLSFTLCSLLMLALLWSAGHLDVTSSAAFSLGILPVALGVWLGNRARRYMQDDLYRRLAMVLMTVLGLLITLRYA